MKGGTTPVVCAACAFKGQRAYVPMSELGFMNVKTQRTPEAPFGFCPTCGGLLARAQRTRSHIVTKRGRR